ncbi:MAG: radical SAM protein [SAR324 cluster bacterium]|nr:radical SAM protein [SAR324 cluster bacterium]
MNIDKVVLINLPVDGKVADFYTPKYAIEDFSAYPPLGLLYVATGIKESYPVKIIDVLGKKYDIKMSVIKVLEEKPAVLGISCQTFYLYPMVAIIEQVKKHLPDLVVVVGGPHVTAFPSETLRLPGVDYCIQGDGDRCFKMLLDALKDDDHSRFREIPGLIYQDDNGEIKKNSPEVLKLGDVPICDRSLIDKNDYFTVADEGREVVTMISSRGCPFKCVFCDVLEKKYRSREAELIVDEMEHILKTFDNPIIHIFDDTFNLNKKRVMDMCQEIIDRGLKVCWTTRTRAKPLDDEMVRLMKESGCRRMHFGVESGSPTSLKLIKKGLCREDIVRAFELCKKHEVQALAYFIIGFEWETTKEIEETIDFIKQIEPSFIMANTLYPAAKTTTYETLLKNGILKKDYWQEYAETPTRDFRLPDYLNEKSLRYLRRKLDEIYMTFYLSPRFVINNLMESRKSTANARKGNGLGYKINMAKKIVSSYLKNTVLELTTSGVNQFKQPLVMIEDQSSNISQ